MIVVMFAFFYFFMMRPQKKQQQQRQEMLSGLKKGDKIITIGGLHGVIDKIDRNNNTVDLDLDGGSHSDAARGDPGAGRHDKHR